MSAQCVKRSGTLQIYQTETFAAKRALTALVSQSVRAEGRCDGEEGRHSIRAVLIDETSTAMLCSGLSYSHAENVKETALLA
jgi:hypothetical protein